MPKPPLSDAIQDYLKKLYHLQANGGRVTVTALAREQQVSPASASAMVKKLDALDLVEHAPYRGVRLTPRPTAGESSSGYGLAVAKDLVERLGGQIWCESTVGQGSCFAFRLPAARDTA